MRPLDVEIPRWNELRAAARSARERAWAPYSKYRVGAAILTDSDDIVSGCNVENASYGLTICAERVAACSAIAAGHRTLQAICVSLTGVPVPCGACRQFLMEFNPDMLVLLDDLSGNLTALPEILVLRDLLPRAFRLQHDIPSEEFAG
jgi:cytidine deaminase